MFRKIKLYGDLADFIGYKELETNTTGAEGASNPETYGYVSAFTSTGFTATRGTDGTGDDYWNESPDKYVAWSWKANGGTTSSNSDGDITSLTI